MIRTKPKPAGHNPATRMQLEMARSFAAIGSELAVLRLKNKMPAGRVVFSPNYDSWVFSLEKKF